MLPIAADFAVHATRKIAHSALPNAPVTLDAQPRSAVRIGARLASLWRPLARRSHGPRPRRSLPQSEC
jgi:hypothetical protein